MTQNEHPITAALVTLIILQAIMLMALFAGVAPHPPAHIPLFGIAPFLAVAISAAVSAIILGPLTSRSGQILTVLATFGALLSFGPQKYVDAQFALIWPAVISGQIAAIIIFTGVARARFEKPATKRNATA